MKHIPMLQVALDTTDLNSALSVTRLVYDVVDIIEAGTILCLAEGLGVVKVLKTLYPEKIIFEDGEVPNGVFFLNKGTAKLSKQGVYGKEQILRFIKEGELIGYRSLLCGENFQAKGEAMTEVEALFLPSEFFLHLL